MRLLPHNITAGLSFRVDIVSAEYAAPAWSLVLYLRGAAAVTIESAANGAAHALTATAAASAAWPAGRYGYSLRATNGVDVVEIEAGALDVLPDLAAAPAGFDARSHARRTLDNLQAVIEKRASMDQQRYKINNRELERMNPGELLRWKTHYAALVRAEERSAKGRPLFAQLKVKM